MAQYQPQIEKKESSAETRERQQPVASPSKVDIGSRESIAGTLTVEGLESKEKVTESAAEDKKTQGDGAQQTKQTGDDSAGAGAAMSFTFDEQNLPPVDDMIRKIEQELRLEIRNLEKQARKYQGGWFTQPDYPNYHQTMIEIRKKNVLLKTLVHLAAEALKKLFLQMFGTKKQRG